jgi:hypothetical protein
MVVKFATVSNLHNTPIGKRKSEIDTDKPAAFQTAVALAVFDAKKTGKGDVKPKITEAHLEQVVKMSTAFKKYMRSAHENMSEEDLAYRYGDRDDHHSSRQRAV